MSKQSEKSETHAAKAQPAKKQELDVKSSKGQRIVPSNQDRTGGNETNLTRMVDKSAAPGKSPYLSSLSDVGKSMHKDDPSAGAGREQPEVKSGSAAPKAAGDAPQKEDAQIKDAKKGPAKEKAADAMKGDTKKALGAEKSPTPEKAPAKIEKSPRTPEEDPAFQSVLKNAKKVAKQQGQHEPAGAKAAQAQAAAVGPPNEVESQAKGSQVEKMDEQEPGRFDRESFKAALLAKIASVAPTNLEEADNFKKDNKASSIKDSVTSSVKQSKESAQGGIKETTAQLPDPSSAKPKEHTDLPATPAGSAPPDVGAPQAAPKPRTESEVSLQKGSQGLEAQMTEAEISEEQLAKSNEPQFQDALKSKKEAQQHSVEAPAGYRQEEQAIITGSQEQASVLAQVQLQSMHEGRQVEFNKVTASQTTAKTADEQRRAEVSTKIESIYTNTKEKVEARLSRLDEEVNSIFDSGLEQATREFEGYVERRMSAYKDERYDGWTGGAKWLKDKIAGMPDEVNVFYEEGRQQYIEKMNAVIDSVATIVENGLNEAKEMISAGRQEVKTYVEGLPNALQDVGKQAEANIESKFDELNQSLDEKSNQLVDSLSQKYVDNLNKVDERINEMKAENKGLVDKAKDAIVGAIKIILKLKDMLLGVLAKVAGVVSKIIKDPIGFVGNLVKGVKAGLSSFMGKIGDYLQQGLFDWLFGALSQAGIQMPKALDFKGILSLVMQVLGLTYPAIRGRAVKLLGEGVVKGLEGASEIFMTLVSEGPGGLWKYIQEKIGDLRETVVEGIKGFLKEKIITAGITWIFGLMNPASAFIKAAKAIYDIIMFFVTRGSQIMSLVDAIVDSMGAIADGGFGVAAAAVEKALGKAVPVVIGFLASLLGLGGVGEKIRGIIQKVQGPVTKAIDWVINKAASLVKGAGKLIGTEKAKMADNKLDQRTNDQKQKDVDGAVAEGAKLLVDDSVSADKLKESLPNIRSSYRLKSLEAVVDETTEEGEVMHIHAEVNPKKDSKKAKKKVGNKEMVQIDSFGSRPGWRPSTKEALAVEKGEDRRHIDAWQTLHERLKLALNGKPFKKAAEILKRIGTLGRMKKGPYIVNEMTNAGVKETGRQYLVDQFNDQENLWVGDAKENQEMGRKFAVAKRKVDKAIETGDKKEFEENIVILESLWNDPDPTAQKKGFVNITYSAVRELRKKFRQKNE